MSRLGGATVDLPKVIQFTEHFFLFNVTTGVAAERSLAHAAGEAAHMPAQVVHLHGTQLAEVNQSMSIYGLMRNDTRQLDVHAFIKVRIRDKVGVIVASKRPDVEATQLS